MYSYKADMHIHSKYSFDSKMELKDIIAEMAKKGVSYIAFNDHVEFSFESLNDIIERLRKRNKEIDELQKETNIKLIKGIEVSEPHVYKEGMRALKEIQDLDYIMGSIHHIDGIPLNKLSNNRMNLNAYLDNLLDMIYFSDIDVVGHLDYIKRVFKHFKADPLLVKEILLNIIEKDLVLEINTSGIRRCGETFPGLNIISDYAELGGTKVTYGSDAHAIGELYDQVSNISQNLKQLKLTPGVIIDHKFEEI